MLSKHTLTGFGLALGVASASAARAGEPLLAAPWRAYDAGDFPTFAPNSVAAGDLNGDGIDDLVIGREMFSGPGVSVLTGRADGSFSPPTVYELAYGQSVGAVALTDFDRDGDLDVLSTIPDQFGQMARLGVWKNDGAGGLAQPSLFATGTGPLGLVVGDFTQDGVEDVVTANYGSVGTGTTISLLRHNGQAGQAASYLAPLHTTVGAGPQTVAAADIDLDGDLDVAAGRTSGTGHAVLFNNGTGGFTGLTYYVAAPGAYATSAGIALADVNLDGLPDMIAGGAVNGGQVYGVMTLRLNLEAGLFGPVTEYRLPEWTYTPRTIRVTDLDRDGAPDAILTVPSGRSVDGHVVLKGDGVSGFEPAQYYRGSKWVYDAIGLDTDGDGDRDVVSVANDASVATVHENIGAGESVTLPEYTVGSFTDWLTAGDIDNDGDQDVITAETQIRILDNRGDGTFAPYRSYSAPFSPGEVHLRDMNADGALDLLIGSGSTQFAVALNIGGGAFAAAVTTFVSSGQAISLDAFDMNSDGLPDVVVSDRINDQIHFFQNLGNGTQFARNTPLDISNPGQIVGSDLDLDGDVDLVTVHSSSVVATILNNGNFVYGPILSTGVVAVDFDVADIDRDGFDDVACLLPQDSFGTVYVATMLGYGDGQMQFPKEFSGPNGREGAFRITNDLLCADLNADGTEDVVLTNNAPADVSIFVSAGAGSLAPQDRYGVGYSCMKSVAADFDGDGITDLASVYALPPGGFENRVAVLRGIAPSGPQLRLDQTPLTRGQETTFQVRGAQASEQVYFLYSFAGGGPGPCPSQLGGLCLDLTNPVTQFGAVRANAAGVATLRLTIPANSPLRVVTTQAVARRGQDGLESVKSNNVADTIRP